MENLSKLVADFVKLKAGKKVLLFRHTEALGEYSGSLVGWTNSKLTIKGRKQANLLYRGLYQHMNSFDGIYSSDLSRCFDNANISLGFRKTDKIIQDPRLRERNYGVDDGVFYDGLPAKDKEKYADFNYKPAEGENWHEVALRTQKFFAQLNNPGNYLIFTHGGLICANTYALGLEDVIPFGSCVGLALGEDSKPKEILFEWTLPEVKEE